MLRNRPDIARHVRELIVRPGALSTSDNQFNASERASAAVRDVAMSKALDALVKFTWDFDDLPVYDDMWFALRIWFVVFSHDLCSFTDLSLSCGQLRYVGTSIGTRVPNLHSHVRSYNIHFNDI